MDPGKLEQRIENKIPDSKKYLKGSPLLGSAIYHVLKVGSRNRSDDELDRQVIDRLENLHRKYTVTQGLRPTPTDMLLGEALTRALAPQVEELRRERFGHIDPPFSTMEEAADWIEQSSEAELVRWREKGKQRGRALEKIERLAQEHLIELDFKSTLLPYQKPGDEHVKSAPAIPRTYLHKLARETASMAKHTGLSQGALVTHVLTGLKPLRSRAQMKTTRNVYWVPSGEQITVNEATVVFRAQDLTEKELRSVYKNVREHVGGKGTRSLEHKDVEIWTLVQELGGPPQQHGSKGLFWNKVLERWNSENPDEPYTSTNWAKNHYFKAAERLKPPRDRRKG